MPIQHTSTTPSLELRMFLDKLSMIAALAKIVGHTSLYDQAKSAHDKSVLQYNERTYVPKKGFWGQFKDNLLFRDLDTHYVEKLDNLENSSSFKTFYEGMKSSSRQKCVEMLNMALKEFNTKHY